MIALVITGDCFHCRAPLSAELPGALIRTDDGSFAALCLCKRCVYMAEELDWALAPDGEERRP